MPVTVDAVAIALGVATPATGSRQAQQWGMWISDANMLIENRRLSLEAEPLNQTDLDYVVREAVVAHARRPDDATQVTISVDDASTSKTFRSGAGRVTIRDEWWSLLGLAGASGGAFSVDTLPVFPFGGV